MSSILKTYTADQLYNMYRLKVLADACGITDFNEGSKTRSLLESNSEIVADISMDFKEGLYNAIPTALYQGFNFAKLAATSASGYIRPYRKPALYIVYTGTGTAALITSSATQIASAVTGAPGDAFTITYAAAPTIQDVVTAIDALANWTAVLVGTGTTASSSIYQYTNKNAVGATNYLYSSGLDIMLDTATAITVVAGYSVTINSITFNTSANTTLPAGDSGVQCAATCTQSGTIGNIAVNAIDTLNGLGSINSTIVGIEHVINDSAFSGGAAEETDSERKKRFSDTVTNLNAGTKNAIIAELKKISGVKAVAMRTSYPFKGTNTIVVDDGTGAISPALQALIDQRLYGDPDDIINYPGKNAEGIGYNTVAPTIINVSITINVFRLPTIDVDLADIATDVQTAIEQYINTRTLGENVLLAEVLRVAMNSNSACYNAQIISPAVDVEVENDEIARTGAGTTGVVTVTATVATNI